MKLNIRICSLAFCALSVAVCRGQSSELTPTPTVVNAIDLASSYLREAVGSEIFERDFQQVGWKDRKRIKNLKRATAVTFRFAPPASPWVDITFEVTVLDDGECSMPHGWVAPDCVETPERCMVEIDREEAVEIAEEFGWQHGDEQWTVELRTMERFEGFVWLVSRRAGPSSRKVLVISAYSGDVLEEHFEMWVD